VGQVNRRVTALLRNEGWQVNHKRVERIWCQEGLKVPGKQPKKGRLWLNDGYCVRLRAGHRDHVWSYDFVQDRTTAGRPIRILTLIDKYTRECLSLLVDRKLNSENVLDELSNLFLTRAIPEHIRSDNGSEFTAKAVRKWLALVGIKTLFIEPGSPWENGYIESFNGKLRDGIEIHRSLRALLSGTHVHHRRSAAHSARTSWHKGNADTMMVERRSTNNEEGLPPLISQETNECDH